MVGMTALSQGSPRSCLIRLTRSVATVIAEISPRPQIRPCGSHWSVACTTARQIHYRAQPSDVQHAQCHDYTAARDSPTQSRYEFFHPQCLVDRLNSGIQRSARAVISPFLLQHSIGSCYCESSGRMQVPASDHDCRRQFQR
ncbi:hypothetical protein EJ03DRAFT_66374 [Teratosphaeria nubilosa]|uniref:Uncharacterized protein n=1 Tax=Teratosphaeria nubilosa TaxID=161662 RepID=A0A6G1LBX8_9PEZI|nr:hypothetical protein EJ03DRAFT_66374 [Teratosphaeria nubilosa]